MPRCLTHAALACLLAALTLPALADSALRETLRQRLEAGHAEGVLMVAGRDLHSLPLLHALYAQRGWRPIWFDAQGHPATLQNQLPQAIDRALDHGLAPEHYHRTAMLKLLTDQGHALKPPARVDLELVASDGLLSLAYHLLHGRVDPETIDSGWQLRRELPDLFAMLAAVRNEVHAEAALDLVDILDGLAPRHPAYRQLREQLALQRELAATVAWDQIDSGPVLSPGAVDSRISAIRERLVLLGDLAAFEDGAAADAGYFDEHLARAVRSFQRRHGLLADGRVGPRTLAELNVPPGQRLAQLRANLERWRWLPRDLGAEYLLVNIAAFSLSVRANGAIVMDQRVVVGTPARSTPVFNGRLSYLVFNPSWDVPHLLAVQDHLPRIRADRSYLERLGFFVYRGWGSEAERVDPDTVDWHALSARDFPYRLRQAPGPDNALGQVKFMFPNRHNVYLHDTPARGLFAKEERAFSSGCIRLEDPAALAHWLLVERSQILSPAQIDAIIASGEETTVRLDRPLPVHLLYWTAWVDEEGLIQYRRDIYRRDPPLIDALDASHPDPQSR